MIVTALVLAIQSASGVTFKDCTSELGLHLGNDSVCWADIDNDGWVDMCAGGAVWKNDGGKEFTRIAEVGQVVAADFDNDGYADLFSWSQMKLYRNVRGKSFEDARLADLPKTVSRGACWGDFNADGFVDLYIGGFEDWGDQITYPSFILVNEGGNRFKLAWTQAKHRTRGVSACDFDRDGDIDVYVSNYRLQPNDLWVNDGKGKFRQAAEEFAVVATSPGFAGGHSIGAAWGDFDNDGEFDLFAGNFAHVDNRGDQPKSRFYRNLGKAKSYHFEDKGLCGVWYQESYSSPAAGDFDNDGNLDLYFTTVYPTASFNRANYPVLYRSEGNFRFADVTKAAGVAEQPATYQAAWADFNHDGYLDLVTAGHLFVNQGSGKHWLEVRLRGDGKAVNRSAIGAQVRITVGKQTLTRQVEAGTGEGNQNDLALHFGFGHRKGTVDIEIAWPNRKEQKLSKVPVDRIVDVKYR